MIKEKVTQKMLSTFGRDHSTTLVVRNVVENSIANKTQLQVAVSVSFILALPLLSIFKNVAFYFDL